MHQAGMRYGTFQRFEGISIQEARSALALIVIADWQLNQVAVLCIFAMQTLLFWKGFTINFSLRIDLPDETISVIGSSFAEEYPKMVRIYAA